MARPRKTVDVEYVKRALNWRIAHIDNPVAREALCWALNDILFEANAYRGYRHIEGWKGVEDWKHEYY